MQIKGTGFRAREVYIKQKFGEKAWNDFMVELSKEDPSFYKPIIPTTLMSVESFLLFNDTLVKKFYNGDKNIYWTFGAESAQWALKDGPYKTLLGEKNYKEFAKTLKIVWDVYYTAGKVEVTLPQDFVVELKITEVDWHHVYFEYVAIGYVERGLQLASNEKVTHERIKGFSNGDDYVHYRYLVGLGHNPQKK